MQEPDKVIIPMPEGLVFTVKAEEGPVLTAMPRDFAEKIINFFETHPEREDCKTGLPNGVVMIIKRADLPKLKAAIPIEKLSEVNIDGEGNFSPVSPETKPVSKQDGQP